MTLVASKQDGAMVAALEIVGRLGPDRADGRGPLILEAMTGTSSAVRVAAIRASRSFPSLRDDPAYRSAVARALEADDPPARAARAPARPR